MLDRGETRRQMRRRFGLVYALVCRTELNHQKPFVRARTKRRAIFKAVKDLRLLGSAEEVRAWVDEAIRDEDQYERLTKAATRAGKETTG